MCGHSWLTMKSSCYLITTVGRTQAAQHVCDHSPGPLLSTSLTFRRAPVASDAGSAMFCLPLSAVSLSLRVSVCFTFCAFLSVFLSVSSLPDAINLHYPPSCLRSPTAQPLFTYFQLSIIIFAVTISGSRPQQTECEKAKTNELLWRE